MTKVKNFLFITSNRNIILYDSHKKSVNNYLITSKGCFTASEYNIIKNNFEQIILLDQFNNDEIVEKEVKELHRLYSLNKIIILDEEDVLRAAKLRDSLGLEGQCYENALAFRNKLQMKKNAQKAGLKVPAFSPITSLPDIYKFIELNGMPVIIKPVLGLHSQNTFPIQNNKELEGFLDLYKSLSEFDCLNFQIEKFIPGEMYQIDGIVREGKILAAWPSKYINTSLNLLKGELFGSYLLSPHNPLVSRLKLYAQQFFEAFPFIKDTVFHLEVFHTSDDQLVFCEIASRIGGGPTRDFWIHSFKVDLVEEFINAQAGLPPSQSVIAFSAQEKNLPAILIYPFQQGKRIKYINKSCPFPWVKKYDLNCKEGQIMENQAKLDDFMAIVSLVAPDETFLTERFREFDEWFQETTVYM